MSGNKINEAAPAVTGAQLDSGSLGDIKNSVNLFRGDVNVPLKLVSFTGRNGMDIKVSAVYESNIHHQAQTWNMNSPTSILGVGWQMPFDAIVVDAKNTGTGLDDDFYLVTGGNTILLYRTGKEGDAISFQAKSYQFWKILYYPNQLHPDKERWEIVKEDGSRYIYGAGNIGGIQWGVKWKNWVGSTTNPSGKQYPVAWNLVEVINIWSDSIRFEYENDEISIGDSSFAKYTRASRVSKIIDVYGQAVKFFYKQKEPFEKQLPHVPPQKGYPNVFQFQYEEKFLDKIEVNNEKGELLFKILCEYDFYNVAQVSNNDDNYKKRYLTGITQLNKDNQGLPGLKFDYYTDSADVNPGAIKTITYSEGGIVFYEYETGVLTNTSTRREIKSPGTDYKPRVWYGPDYVVVVWYSAAQNKAVLNVYSWGGSWTEWNGEILGKFNLSDFQVLPSNGFFAVYFNDFNQGWYKVFLFKQNEYRFGEWLVEEVKLDNGFTSLSITCGNDFVVLFSHNVSRPVIKQWNALTKAWEDGKGNINVPSDFSQIALTGSNDFFLAAYYSDSRKDLTFQLYYLDENREWMNGGKQVINAQVDWKYTKHQTFWALGDSFAAATYIKEVKDGFIYYDVGILQWREDFSFVFTEIFPYQQEASMKNLINFSVISGALIGNAQHLFRYNGESWKTNEIAQPKAAGEYRYAYGDDVTVMAELQGQTEYYSSYQYSPYQMLWKEGKIQEQSAADDGVVAPAVRAGYCTAGIQIYFQDSSLNWKKIYTLPEAVDMKSIQNRAPFYIAYQLHNDQNAYLLFLKDGKVKGSPVKLFNEQIYIPESGNGRILAGPDAFVTFKDYDFDKASKLYLYRVINESIEDKQKDYSVSCLSIDDGYNQVETFYVYDRETATYDPYGKVAQFVTVKIYRGSKTGKNGYIENIYFNGLSSDVPGIHYPETDEFTNIREYFSLFNGQIYRSISYDGEGEQVSSTVNYFYAYDKTFSGVNLYGVYTRLRKKEDTIFASVFRNESEYAALTKVVEHEYNINGQVSKTINHNYNSHGQKEKLMEENKYGWEENAYPEMRNIHLLTPLVETKKSSEINGKITITGMMVATYKKEWSSAGGGASWANHKSYQWDGTQGTEIFNFSAWSGDGEPPNGWIKISEIIGITPGGLVRESMDIDNIHTSILYDTVYRLRVAEFSNASVLGDEAGYYGFEEYEALRGWSIFPEGKPVEDYINTGDSYTGVRRLFLPGNPGQKVGLHRTFKPAGERGKFILSCYVKTEKGFESGSQAAGWDITVCGSTVFVPIAATDGKWKQFHYAISSDDFGGQPLREITLFVYNRHSDKYLLVDNIGFTPFPGEFNAVVYDSYYKLKTSSLGLVKETIRTVYDYLQRPAAEIGNEEKPLILSAQLLWKQYNKGAFNSAFPNFNLNITVRRSGIFSDFHHGNQWQEHWEASSGWQVEDFKLVYSGGQQGTVSLKGSDSYKNYGIRFKLSSQETIDKPIGINIGDCITVRWQQGEWELYDKVSRQVVDSFVQPEMNTKDWLLIVGQHTVLFFADGRQVFQYIFRQEISGSLDIFTSNRVALEYLIVFTDPVISITYVDNSNKPLQAQSLDDMSTLVSAVCYDVLGREGITTKTARFENALFQYRKNFIKTVDWTTGVMIGEICDYYPCDEGYPYSRKLFENSSLSRVIEVGIPGKLLAVNLEIPRENRHTTITQYLLNSGSKFTNDLRQGEYPVTVVTDSDKNLSIKITDRFDNAIIGVSGMSQEGEGDFVVTRNYYDVYGDMTRVELPNFFKTGMAGCDKFFQQIKYDFFSRMVYKKTPDIREAFLYVYDKGGRVRFMRDANGKKEEYLFYWLYDSLGRLIEEGTCDCQYDEPRLKQHADEKGWLPVPGIWSKKYEYDGNGSDISWISRLYRVQVSDTEINTGIGVEEIFYYNDRGNISSKDVKVYRYDGGISHKNNYEYDNMGNIIEMAYSAENTIPFVVFYEFDNLARMSRVKVLEAPAETKCLASYRYNADGSINSETFNPGAVSELIRSYEYYSPGWLKQIKDRFFTETLQYAEGGYADAGYYSGKAAHVDIKFNGVSDSEGFVTSYQYKYAYDRLGRLCVAQNTVNNIWSMGTEASLSYDANGNMIQEKRKEEVKQYQYYSGTDKLKNTTGGVEEAYQYNPNGNVEKSQPRGINKICYERTSQMTSQVQLSNTQKVSFQYDGGSRRVMKKQGDKYVLYLLSVKGEPLIEKSKDAGSEESVKIYIYGATGLFAVKKNNRLLNLLKDHQNSTRVVFDVNGVCNAYNYMPFGGFMGAVFENPSTGRVIKYLYTGQELDEETGIYNYNARFYDADIGRFYSVDPAAQFPSSYIYADNDPVNSIDPSGEFSFLIALLIAIAVGAVVGGASYGIIKAIKGEKFNWGEFGVAIGVGAVAAGVGFAAGTVVAAPAYSLGAAIAGSLGAGEAAATGTAVIVEGIVAGAVGGAAGSASGQLMSNIVEGREWDENLTGATLFGALTGAVLGGALGAYSRYLGKLRMGYVRETRALRAQNQSFIDEKMPALQRAQTLAQTRRDIGIHYKKLTLQPVRKIILWRNRATYGDEWGPTWQWLVEKNVKKFPTEELVHNHIAGSASRTSRFWTFIAPERNWQALLTGAWFPVRQRSGMGKG